MTVLATPSDGYRATATSSIDRAIRLSTAAAVLAVAGIAAYVSYWHAYAVVRAYGETGITARLEPATIDGLVYASSMVVLYAARHRVPVPSLARWLLGLGIAATLTANMAQGWSHGLVGAVVAAWAAVSLVGAHELLVWLIRTSGTVERRPSAQHPCEEATFRGAGCSAAATAVDSEQQSRSDRDPSAQDWRPTGQPAGQPTAYAGAQHDGGAPEADADNDAAVAAYRLSVRAGNPLSERKLAQTFGRTSRRWARARIAKARQAPLASKQVMLPGGGRARTLRSINPVESMIEICREHSKNVKRWRDGTMALRWCAAGMLEAGHQFRRVNGHLHLPKLRAALEAHFTANASPASQDEDQKAA